MEFIVGLFMIIMGIGIAGMWTIDILRNPEIDRSHGFVRARDRSGSVMLPHWVAEYATAMLCLTGGSALVLGWTAVPWSWLVPIALGALGYTSLNSLSWVLADRSRLTYGLPMLVGLVGALIAIVPLLTGSLL